MDSSELIHKISEVEFDINQFVLLANHDVNIRVEIKNNMINNPGIMVYYHCFYIIESASREHPELYYPYWNDFARLLSHKNSYHRDFALEIIGNLLPVDNEDKFQKIHMDYFEVINDEKFMTGNLCVKNLLKVYYHKPEFRKWILDTLLDIDNHCDYSEKQKAVMKADILEIFSNVYSTLSDRSRVDAFIRTEVNSISPKTRKKAKSLIQLLNLSV